MQQWPWQRRPRLLLGAAAAAATAAAASRMQSAATVAIFSPRFAAPLGLLAAEKAILFYSICMYEKRARTPRAHKINEGVRPKTMTENTRGGGGGGRYLVCYLEPQ